MEASKRELIGERSIPIFRKGGQELRAIIEEIFANRVEYVRDDGADLMVLSLVTKQLEHLRSVTYQSATSVPRSFRRVVYTGSGMSMVTVMMFPAWSPVRLRTVALSGRS